MKLLKTDHFSKIGVLMRAGMLTQEDYTALKNKAQRIDFPKNIIEYTLDEYFGLLKAITKNDVEVVRYVFPKINLRRLNVGRYFSILRTIDLQFDEIKKAFESIKRPPLSQEAIRAGFQNLDFGDFGLLDYMAKRQMMTDEEASKTPLGLVIMKLQNDAEVAMCEYRMNEILKEKYR